jgi:hypothetical protein
MISYLLAISTLPKIIPNDDVTDLLDLVRFGFRAIALQIDLFFDPCFPEHVMAAEGAFGEAQRQQERPQVFEANVRIARSAVVSTAPPVDDDDRCVGKLVQVAKTDLEEGGLIARHFLVLPHEHVLVARSARPPMAGYKPALLGISSLAAAAGR